ncbi:MAG: TetR/AcrR family transcriptional regulator [Actinomycetia bacterium]|nr:TetR/AcrR family transcriptional regulator [Actinomycetes bacterium]
MAGRSRRRLAPETRRQELLDALAAELAETQWHRISVPMVVRRAGASQGLFYRYFGDLDEAFIALVDDRIVPRLSDIGGRLRLDVGSPEAVEAMLTGWFEGLAELMVDEPHVIKATLLAAPTGAGAAADYCRGLLDELRQWGQGLLEQVNGTGPYRKVDAALVAHMVVGMTVQCVSTGMGAIDPARWASEMARFEAFGLLRRDEVGREIS